METLGIVLLIGGGIVFNAIPVATVKLISIPFMDVGYLLIKYSPHKGVTHG